MSYRTAIQRASAMLSRQVQWQHPMVVRGGIDQTRLSITKCDFEQNCESTIKKSNQDAFSFVVMGDTDFGESKGWSQSQFAEMFAEQMEKQIERSQLLLHTGDVTYPVGSYQNYYSGFLRPYRSLFSQSPNVTSDYTGDDLSNVVFNKPVLPVPGNHDYAQLPFWPRLCQQLARFWYGTLLRIFRFKVNRLGGQGGEAYGQIFLDDLEKLSPKALKQHLMAHYSAQLDTILEPETNNINLIETGEPTYCLSYVPGQFTRLPNRYYTFSYQSIDFFALDSNTWNMSPESPGFDQAQLDWLEDGLVQSWRSPHSLGRILYLHHSPYTTERIRWQQPETLWVRRHLRQVLDNVKARLVPEADWLDNNPLVNLVISGHAHCLEHIKTKQTGHGDANIDWLVCGGSGLDLRRQRSSGSQILESLTVEGCSTTELVAESVLYAGLHGQKEKKQHFHSFVRIDVPPGDLRRLVICPFVVVKGRFGWQTNALDPIVVGGFLKSRSQLRDIKSSERLHRYRLSARA